MSRVADVIKNKNKVKKKIEAKRLAELNGLREDAAFMAKIHEELDLVDTLMLDEKVDSIIISVPDKSYSKFSLALYSNEFMDYNVRQVEGSTNKFEISRKYLDI